VTFLSANWLWLLAGVAALAIVYVVAQRRRRAYAVRFTNLELLDVVAPERPGWRRHLPAAALLLGMIALVTAMARPAREVQVAKERATLIVALDTSISMEATDVEPDRMSAARDAATSFVENLPEGLNVGLVTFNRNVAIQVSPTEDRDAVVRAIDNAEVSEGTAIGEALVASVEAARSGPEGLDVPDGTPNGGDDGSPGAGTERGTDGADGTEGEDAPALIVLLSDGKTTVGRPDSEGVIVAQEAGIPVSTIAFGTDEGVLELPDRPVYPVPVDRPALRNIAEQTGGSFFEAATEAELSQVYANIGSAIGYDTEQREIGQWFVGGGLLALLAAAAMSLVWFSRLP
jgi:Ca-activated chloride channel homolog